MITVGGQQLCTLPHVGGGRNPTWTQAVHFTVTGTEQEATVEIKVGCTRWRVPQGRFGKRAPCMYPSLQLPCKYRTLTIQRGLRCDQRHSFWYTLITPWLRLREQRARLQP